MMKKGPPFTQQTFTLCARWKTQRWRKKWPLAQRDEYEIGTENQIIIIGCALRTQKRVQWVMVEEMLPLGLEG